jgi:eukaryotic-like serine/threonine-protein kinase
VATLVGPYRIRESLAEGAVTTLFRAEHEHLGRVVLLKTLKKTLVQGSPFAATIEREAKILSRIGHANLPKLLDVSAESPPTWLAMENIEGPSLAALTQATRRIEMTSAVAIGLELALGISHLHSRHIILNHLDPKGISLSFDGRVVWMDLGSATDDKPTTVSKFEPPEGKQDHRYSAPEQIMGEPGTFMSDVFSLGLLLYEMLCGEGPWDEGKPSASELSRRMRSEEPRAISSHGLRISNQLSQVIMRCLSKRPEERFEDAVALAAALEPLLDSISPLSTPILVTRALAAAGLGQVLPEEKGRRKRKIAVVERSLRPLASQLAGLLALIIGGTIVIEGFLREGKIDRAGEERLNGSDRGYLRVLAHPWAEVFVDGKLIDVTPMAKPIVVSVGRHFVTFKHPNAPDEQRSIMVSLGQTVLLDVTMRLDRRTIDAGTDAASDAPISP